jgi:hypothetical protein
LQSARRKRGGENGFSVDGLNTLCSQTTAGVMAASDGAGRTLGHGHGHAHPGLVAVPHHHNPSSTMMLGGGGGGGGGLSLQQLESVAASAGMNHYITTLKSSMSIASSSGAATCALCPHPYCDASAVCSGDGIVGGMQQLQPLPPVPASAAVAVSSSSSARRSMMMTMRAPSPGNHTYMELELNGQADGSTIYAEIDHAQAQGVEKYYGAGGQQQQRMIESGYEYARSRGVVYRAQQQLHYQQQMVRCETYED